MLSVQNLYENQNIEIIEESALLRKIGAAISGIGGGYGGGSIVGEVQGYRQKTYQNLSDKLNNRSMTKNPSMLLAGVSGLIPMLSIFFLVARQSKIEDLKSDIKNKLSGSQVQQLNDLKNKLSSNKQLSDKEIKLITDLELKLQKTFSVEEMNAFTRILKQS